MGRQSVVTQTGAGTPGWVPLDTYVAPQGVSVSCVVTGTVTDYDVDVTYDDVNDPDATITAWPTAINAETTSQADQMPTPISAVRLTIITGTGSVAMTVLQQGIGR